MARLAEGRTGPIFAVEKLRSLSGLDSGITVTDTDGARIWLSRDVLAHLFGVAIAELQNGRKRRLSANAILDALCDCPKKRKKKKGKGSRAASG